MNDRPTVDAIIAAILGTKLSRLDVRAIRNALPTIYRGPYKAFCKREHPRTPENLNKNGACKLCRADRDRERVPLRRAQRREVKASPAE